MKTENPLILENKKLTIKEIYIMKKRLVVVLCVAMLMVTGCGNKVICDFCGEEKPGQTGQVLGQEVNVCDDCIECLQRGY